MSSWLLDAASLYIDYYGPFLKALWKGLSGNAKEFTESFAVFTVIVGAGSAYLRFLWGQTLFYRLDPKVTAELLTANNGRFMKVRVEVKNVGTVGCHFASVPEPIIFTGNFLTKWFKTRWELLKRRWINARRHLRGENIEFKNKSVMVVYSTQRLSTLVYPHVLDWDGSTATNGLPSGQQIAACTIFPHQEWVRSGETIADEYLIEIPSTEKDPLRIIICLHGKPRALRPCGDGWTASTILQI